MFSCETSRKHHFTAGTQLIEYVSENTSEESALRRFAVDHRARYLGVRVVSKGVSEFGSTYPMDMLRDMVMVLAIKPRFTNVYPVKPSDYHVKGLEI
jgi:hypothetical protein